MGALYMTKQPGMHNHSETASRLAQFLGLTTYRQEVAEWNDARTRTKEEVIAALEAAAKGECNMLYDRKRWEPKIPIVKPVKPRAKPKPPEPWQQVLRKAALYIKQHGWCRRRAENAQGNVCILGAIHRVSGQYHYPELHQAQQIFEQHIGHPAAGWNDKIARSADEVIRTLRAAAKQGA